MPITPTSALLLEAIRGEHGGAGATPGRSQVRSDREWRSVLEAAEWHRLGPVLLSHLSGHGAVPGWVMADLEQTYLRQMARAALVARTTQLTLGVLAGAGIPAMLLKGAALVEAVYPDPATRDMGDVDVLVAAGDLPAAAEALADAGFRPDANDAARREAMLADGWHQDVPMVHSDGVVPVELHRQIVNYLERGPQVEPGDLFTRARPGRSEPAHLLPAPEDLLLHTCLHFLHGRGVRSEGALAEVRDVVAIIAQGDVDWDSLVRHAGRYRARAHVHLALFSVSALGFELPAAALDRLRPAGFSASAGRRFVARRVVSDHVRVPLDAWVPTPEGARTALMWSRRNLASRRGLPAEATKPLLSRRSGLMRLVGHTVRRPRALVDDLRIARWMEDMT